MRRTIAVVTVAAALLAASAAGAGAAAPPGVECGDTVSGDVVLTHDLVCSDVALYLTGPTQVDLAGFTLKGPGRDSGVPALTFPDDPDDPVAVGVSNGKIKNWGDLVSMGGYAQLQVTTTDVTVRDLGRFTDAWYLAATIQSSHYRDAGEIGEYEANVTVRDSVLQATSIHHGAGEKLVHIVIERSTIKDVPSVAIHVGEGDVAVTDSTFVNNGHAIETSWTWVRISGSVFRGNGTAVTTDEVTFHEFQLGADSVTSSTFVDNGTALDIGADMIAYGNDFRGNDRALYSQKAGTPWAPFEVFLEQNSFRHNGDAIYIEGPSGLRFNSAFDNSGYGIYAPEAYSDEEGGNEGNVAARNGISPQCTGVVCTERRRS